jgi:hypothetical protein
MTKLQSQGVDQPIEDSNTMSLDLDTVYVSSTNLSKTLITMCAQHGAEPA